MRLYALSNIGSLAVRAACSTLLLLSSGYEADAHAPTRRLMELYARASVIFDDKAGSHAQNWFRNRNQGSPARLVQKYLGDQAKNLMDLLSRSTHDDSRGLQLLWDPPAWIQVPNEARSINVFPTRTPRHASALLYYVTRQTTEIAVFIIDANGTSIVIPGVVSELLQRHDLEAF